MIEREVMSPLIKILPYVVDPSWNASFDKLAIWFFVSKSSSN